MKSNPLRKIREFGQSIWQDDLSRSIILSGELKRLIEEDGIRGITSNPSIFDKSITGSRDYDDAVRTLALQGLSSEEIYQMLTVRDVQMAADLLRPVYEDSDGKHGFVSLEVNPHLARDMAGTLAEARRLWHALARPNAMIKVPGTTQGLSCIRQLISEGININVTLLFGLPRYREVAQAYLDGLEARAAADEPIRHVASVASFFLSRIDVREPIRPTGSMVRSPSPAPRAHTASTGRFSKGNDSVRSRKRGRAPSGCYGPAPALRSRNSATSNMWRL